MQEMRNTVLVLMRSHSNALLASPSVLSMAIAMNEKRPIAETFDKMPLQRDKKIKIVFFWQSSICC
jgi:hypothetical protein